MEWSDRKCTIYALTAELNDGQTCYIGQASNFRKRMMQHHSDKHPKSASSQFIKQALLENHPVMVLPLEEGLPSGKAILAESAWIWKAHELGFNMIRPDQWWKCRNESKSLVTTKIWPDASKARPLTAYARTPEEQEEARRYFLCMQAARELSKRNYST